MFSLVDRGFLSLKTTPEEVRKLRDKDEVSMLIPPYGGELVNLVAHQSRWRSRRRWPVHCLLSSYQSAVDVTLSY
jgi:hypothetical protein